MKAKARLFVLLIGMISLVGFGHTTDLGQNSNIDTACYEAPEAVVCVNFEVSEATSLTLESLATCDIGYRQDSTVFKSDLNLIENRSLYDLSFGLKPTHLNIIHNKSLSTINRPGKDEPNQPCCNYCKYARDGLVKPNNFIS